MGRTRMLANYVAGEECRVAVVADGQLEEYHSERADSENYVGNIYVGRVMNVEAGIQAAFIDFGLGANGFLHVSDLHPRYFPGEEREDSERIGKKTPRSERPPIQHCLKRGQEIIVQVLKEGISTKGPTLTSYLSIPGRYLVMLPWMDRVGVSKKVEDDEVRRAARDILDALSLPEDFGFILRTAGIGRLKNELRRDLAYLQRLWKDMERRRNDGGGPRLLYAESDLLMRCLRDIWTSEIDEIIIDDDTALTRAARFMKIVSPRGSTKLLRYNRELPLFHAFDVEDQIAQIFSREVPLKSGGSLIFDETEALIAIDVNSGKMRNHGDAETTAYRTNREAVPEICRQLRLRDAGGLVLCDLIDMFNRKHRRDIEGLFRECLKKDRAAAKTLPISQFGIVEMTRQRVRGSKRSQHFTRCPKCDGQGMLKRPESAAADALRDLAMYLAQERVAKVEMVVSPRVAGELLSNRRLWLGDLERRSSKHVDVRVSEDIPADRVAFYAYDDAGADVALDRLPRVQVPQNLPVWKETEGAHAPVWDENTFPEHDPLRMDMDDLARDDEQEDGAQGSDRDAEKPTKKRRRRRRRRGKRDSSEGESQDSAQSESAEQTEAAESPSKPSREGDESQHENEESKPRAKRGRRRRRGRSRSSDEATVDASTNGEMPPRESSPPDREPEHKPEPVEESRSAGQSGFPMRGDSWDLEPSAVTPMDPPKKDSKPVESKSAPESSEQVKSEEPAEEPSGSGRSKSPRRRGRRGGKKSASSKASAQTAPETASESRESAPQAEAPAADPPVKKKSRSRKKPTAKKEGSDVSSFVEATAEPEKSSAKPDASSSAKTTTKKKKRSRRSTKSADKSAEKSGDRPAAAAESSAKPKSSSKSGPDVIKPIASPRPLYRTRRRLSGAEAAQIRDKDV